MQLLPRKKGVLYINTRYLKVLVILALVLILGLGVRELAKAKRVSCKSFTTHRDAQNYFDQKLKGYKNLDHDKNGIVCQELLKGNL